MALLLIVLHVHVKPKKMKETKSSHKGVLTLTAALVAGAAVGTYFLYGSKNAKKYRSNVKSWIFKAKGEVIEAIEKLEDVTEDQYHMIIDRVTAKYESMPHVDMSDIKKLKDDLKKHWVEIVKTAHSKKKTRASKKK